jgi:hypothetical protein
MPAGMTGRVNGLYPSVDGLVCDFWILGPVRNQAPPQSVQSPLPGFWIESDRENILRWSNVPTNRQISLRRDRNMMSASKLFLRRGSSITSAHTQF